MSTVAPLSAWNKGTNVLIFSCGLPVAAIFNFASVEDEADLQLKTWPLYHTSTFQMLSEVSGNVGVSKGSLHWSSTSGKRQERAWGAALAAEGRYPADLAFVCRCSKWSVSWQLIIFFHQVWIWAENLTHSPMHSEQCEFQQVLRPPGFFFPGKRGNVTFWPWGATCALPSFDSCWFLAYFILCWGWD